MVRRVRFATAALMVMAACSGGDGSGSDVRSTDASATTGPATVTTEPELDDAAGIDDADEDGDDGEPTTEPTTTLPREAPPTTEPRPTRTLVDVDPDTGEVTEIEVSQPGPATFADVVDFGIEAGLWDELEGLTLVLDHVVGKLPAEYVPGADEVQAGDLTEVLVRAEEAIEQAAGDPALLARLERRYSFIVPSQETLDAMTQQEGAAVQGFAAGPASAAACEPVDPDEWDSDAWLEGCYAIVQEMLPDATLRVFYPSWYDDDGSLASLPGVTLAALVKSIDVYRELGRVGNIDVIFSATDTVSNANALASAMRTEDGDVVDGCRVTLWPVSSAASIESFEQTVAHEAWHCIQYYDGMQYSDGDWFVEGGAEFFSNVVYPRADDEHVWLGRFDRGAETPLHQMAYEAWIWWQHVSNEFSPRFVADLHREMYGQGAIALGPLAGFDETFHDFVADYVAGAILDQSGQQLPRARMFFPYEPVTEDHEGRRIERTITSWTPVRFHIPYDQELRFLQTDASSGGLRSMVKWTERFDRAAWQGVFPEIRSTCTERARFAGVITDASTTAASGAIDLQIVIDEIEKAECDPCLLGTWSLDLETFEQMIGEVVSDVGGGLPPGTTFDIEGAYYVAFEEDSLVKEQRDGLTIISTVAGLGSLRTIIDSYGEGSYTADGEVVTVTDIVESFNEVTFDGPVQTSYSFPGAIEDGAGPYTCDDDVFEVAVDGHPAVTFNRVDKILAPPDAPTDPDVAQPDES